MKEPVLDVTDVDRLGQALLTLTKELWVLRDRQRILEAALADAGVLGPGTVERYAPGEELRQALRAERQQLIDNVLDALHAPGR
jgi:hypothetical protein